MAETVIEIPGSVIPTSKDTPLDNRSRINTISEITNIIRPYEGLVVFVKDEKDYYKITKVSTLGKVKAYEKLISANETGTKLVENKLYTPELSLGEDTITVDLEIDESNYDIFMNFNKSDIDSLIEDNHGSKELYDSNGNPMRWGDTQQTITLSDIKNLLDENPDTILCVMGVGSNYITVSIYY